MITDSLYTTDKKTGGDWAKHFDDQIMDPDGWRHEGMHFFKEEITYSEYMDRLSSCTMRLNNNTHVRFHNRHHIHVMTTLVKEIKEKIEDINFHG